jgi:hypothetical protein
LQSVARAIISPAINNRSEASAALAASKAEMARADTRTTVLSGAGSTANYGGLTEDER